ncbi:MAG TPA: hypothetical protein VG798_06655 [Rhizomicrobium sp.]|nr:hypothetical protein [Rhizomicrobium sp.]
MAKLVLAAIAAAVLAGCAGPYYDDGYYHDRYYHDRYAAPGAYYGDRDRHDDRWRDDRDRY